MKLNKSGFTLGEVLICVAIIGIIMALSVRALKIVRSSYTALTYYAFNTVRDAVGELYSGDKLDDALLDNDGKKLESAIMACQGTNGIMRIILKPDGAPNKYISCNDLFSKKEQGTKKNIFCKSIVSMANTVGKTDCENLKDSTINSDTKEPYIQNFGEPNFITTNGMRYYISKWDYNTQVSKDYGYRLVSIDLNGSSRPNMSERQTNNQIPDIVTFLVLDNGEVLPIGIAADNTKSKGNGKTITYINSKVKGYYYGNAKDRKEGVPEDCHVKTKDGTMQICNYAVSYLQNPQGKELKNGIKMSFFSYRQAYCSVTNEPVLTNYCNGIEKLDICPPSDLPITNDKSKQPADLCLIENIKPMFRYNLK